MNDLSGLCTGIPAQGKLLEAPVMPRMLKGGNDIALLRHVYDLDPRFLRLIRIAAAQR